MRIIAKFEKRDAVRFVSHLDVQRLFQRAFLRADIPLAYSQGFNPHPQLSFATALAVGYTSSAEWLDVKLSSDMAEADFIQGVNHVLPNGFFITKAQGVPDHMKALTAMMVYADYEVAMSHIDKKAVDSLTAGEIIVAKRTKAGMKTVDLSHQLLALSIESDKLMISGRLDASGSLNIELLMGVLRERTAMEFTYSVHRKEIYSADGLVFPKGVLT